LKLLSQFDARGGDYSKSMGAHTFGQREAAEQAGLSKHQKDTAVRVASVSAEDFDAMVEGENRPT